MPQNTTSTLDAPTTLNAPSPAPVLDEAPDAWTHGAQAANTVATTAPTTPPTATAPECTECAASIPATPTLPGEILDCPECGAELEVRSLSPLTLALAPAVEEDWGE